MGWENNMYVYVYYKLVPTEFPSLHSQIKTLQSTIEAEFVTSHSISIRSQLFKRPELDKEGRETWMEVYNLNALTDETVQEFLACLQQLALEMGLPQPRACEKFQSI